jgi:hypothetical protein
MNTIANATSTVTKGNGTAIHAATVAYNHSLATLCDTWGSTGGRSIRVHPSAAVEITCKSCLKAMKNL